MQLNNKWIISLNDLDKDELKEDLFQASYCHPEHGIYTLDVGWYETIFKVLLIREYNWEVPIKEIVTLSLEDAVNSLIKVSNDEI